MDFDYVVVGGGSAGCALAARLSEDPSVSVCLLEAGGSGRSVLIDTPILLAVTVPRATHNWALETVPQAGLAGRLGFQPRGKALGGSSAINAMVYMRGHPRAYADWAAAGNPGWGWADVLPLFKRGEHNERGADPAVLLPPLQHQKISWLRRNRWMALVAAIGIVLGGVAVWKVYLGPATMQVALVDKTKSPLPDPPSLAVLPFVNMSGDPKQEFLSDGITEEIITALSRFPSLLVISRQSTFTYKGKPVKVKQVSEEWGSVCCGGRCSKIWRPSDQRSIG